MIENLGVCKGPGTVLGCLEIGSDGLQISKNGKNFYILLNNRTILSAKSEKIFLTKNIPVAATVIKRMTKKAGIDSLRWLPTTNVKKDNEMISDSLKYIRENLEPAEVFVLQINPDEIQDQLPKEASKRFRIANKISDYRDDLKLFDQTLSNLRYASEVLLRTNLERKMWGSKGVMDIIHEAKSEMDRLAEDFEISECMMEHSDDRARIIQAAMDRKLKTPPIKETAGKVIENFSFIKSFMSKVAQNLHSLYVIDKDFKARVGYPATWFFNPSIFMNFTYEYENLMDHMIKTASLETEVIEPLLVWKMTGV